MTQQAQPYILCVDDDADDLMMLREAFEANGCTYGVEVACDGEEALSRLRNTLPGQNLPSLIVLDVNMPRIDGRETLLALQKDSTLSKIPVVAYSTSSSPLDKLFFNRLNVAFFTKPSYFNELESVAATMLHFCNPSNQQPMIH
ncbi:response regulator receiver protein [Cnuella takakiae]|uniref:Response regulator receiver protein n=1 Tax=Cnuella takakiae TaxID=1302690 RepID=A0A1M4YHU4_9BACT|nr:response regulator [Cnuella takakiae]OLY93153.1 hypothetical protein BUE76_15600 [Cnuella takakiae]SHF05241.1 response regulator receiver protein [Cnuella takakiae]